MNFTKLNTDLIIVTEADLTKSPLDKKVHLIKFKFEDPTEEKVLEILRLYPDTNRFIVGNYVKEYNAILRDKGKKYYIQNTLGRTGLISLMRKNNKVMLSVPSLVKEEKSFVLKYALGDVLRNLEIIMIDKKDFEKVSDNFRTWSGNVVLWDGEQEYL